MATFTCPQCRRVRTAPHWGCVPVRATPWLGLGMRLRRLWIAAASEQRAALKGPPMTDGKPIPGSPQYWQAQAEAAHAESIASKQELAKVRGELEAAARPECKCWWAQYHDHPRGSGDCEFNGNLPATAPPPTAGRAPTCDCCDGKLTLGQKRGVCAKCSVAGCGPMPGEGNWLRLSGCPLLAAHSPPTAGREREAAVRLYENLFRLMNARQVMHASDYERANWEKAKQVLAETAWLADHGAAEKDGGKGRP